MSLESPDLKQLKAIMEWVAVTDDIRELSLRIDGVELHVSRNRQSAPITRSEAAVAAPVSAPAVAPVAAAAVAPSAAVASGLAADEIVIKAPMVGTFYAAHKPGAAPFISVGDRVQPDSVLGIVEVMKLMNNIEAGVTGTITKILVGDEQAVQYGQPLVVVRKEA